MEKFGDKAEEVFDDYWINYRTSDEAKKLEMEKPNYTDIDSYLEYKKNELKTDTDLFGDLLNN